MMPTPEAAAAWNRRLAFEVQSSEMTGRALGNSATARRLAEQKDAEGLVGDLVMDAITGTAAPSLIKRILGSGPRWLRDTLRSRTDRELGDMLTNPRRLGEMPNIVRQTLAGPGSGPGIGGSALITGSTAAARQQ